MSQIKVLFVCMGNICRSPTAEGVFSKLLATEGISSHFMVDSAGTHAYHVGEAPDARAQQASLSRGIDISGQRARRVLNSDFEQFDYILVMDHENHAQLMSVCPDHQCHKINYLLDFSENWQIKEVPDPYYGGSLGFERVLDMVEDAAQGFLAVLNRDKIL